ncbi:MAG: HAMP domain-containing histidine kinase [Myxococcales bacterium]|nr:HAMP domain-containing histidine kinase [Myxococcales bacterium]
MSSLRTRVALVVLGVTLGTAGALLFVVTGPLTWLTLAGSAHLFQAVPDEALVACDTDPAHWAYRTDRGLEAWALDPVTHTPLHAGAPEVPGLLALRLAAGEDQPVVVGRREGGGALVVRREGPCASVMVLWPIPLGTYRLVGRTVALVILLTLVLAGLAGWLGVLRPLLASVLELDRASRAVGRDDYRPARVQPDLDAVREALDDAHARVLDDRDRLVRERETLERHIADVAHDLRTPIAALQLRLERLADGDGSALPGALADVGYLGLLTENLATAGQLRAGLRELDGEVDVAAVAQRVVDRFAGLGRRRGVEVIAALPDGPVVVPGLPVYVEQILANLVHNAVRHHDGEGTVVVVVEPGERVRIEVADDGPGRPEDLPDARAAAGSAHGLGLSIVRELVATLGWTLSVEAGEPRGLVFVLLTPSG